MNLRQAFDELGGEIATLSGTVDTHQIAYRNGLEKAVAFLRPIVKAMPEVVPNILYEDELGVPVLFDYEESGEKCSYYIAPDESPEDAPSSGLLRAIADKLDEFKEEEK